MRCMIPLTIILFSVFSGNIHASSYTREVMLMTRIKVEVTAYSSEEKYVGTVTASGEPVREGIIAISRDLRAEHGINFGDRVHLEGFGVFQVQDLMNARWERRVDIWCSTLKEAQAIGKRESILTKVEEI